MRSEILRQTRKLNSCGSATAPSDYPADKVSVVTPDYGSDIGGDVTIQLKAPGLTSATVNSWQAGGTFGSDSVVGTVTFDADGNGLLSARGRHSGL